MTTIPLSNSNKTCNLSASILCLIFIFAFSAFLGCSSSTDSDTDSGEITYDLMKMDYGKITDVKFGTIKVEANDSESVYLTINATHADFQHNSYDIQLSDEDPNAGGIREFSFKNNGREKSTIGNFSQITASGRYLDVIRAGVSPGTRGVGRSKK